ncbi:hypothetical protein PV08_02931 [Exophiala spinifera]|uniref:NmrA-like domain-containing protein n=1 Tax=Exophiala spinifera TaxID=91928 RepID=A0A0D2A0Z3_9EURO|nr:uncharacterized protein PV08_02931 [Exophiala spinifera]KIW18642.1 hypothetical protein PV08_02931 [Exophiala spinifera]
MDSNNHISKVALVGATGTLGSHVLSGLLDQPFPQFQITLITRPGSITSSKHPDLTSNPRITIKVGSYEDHAFLVSALTGQDALVVTLGFNVCHTLQPLIFRVACEVKVPYILPCEFGSDTTNPRLVSAIPGQISKVNARRLIEDLGTAPDGTRTSSWIGICTNAWLDWNLPGGWMEIDIKNRTATLLDGQGKDKDVKAYFSTIRMSALTAAKVLSLPLKADDKSSGSSPSSFSTTTTTTTQRTLPSFANKMVYAACFRLSQADIICAVQRATRTTDTDWQISHVGLTRYLDSAAEKVKAGNRLGIMDLLHGNLFVKGVADAFYPDGAEEEAELNNTLLGLDECEDLGDVMAKIVKQVLIK